MPRSPRSRSPQRRGGNMRNGQGRSPRARLTRGRSPRPRSLSRGSPLRMHESSRLRRSPDRQRNGVARNNSNRGTNRGRGKGVSQRLRQPQAAKWGQPGRKKGRRRGRRSNNGPNLSGGNRQPVTSMRMRMDDYVHPKGGKGSNRVKGNDVEHVVARARKEASTRTKDTFWTKKLLDAESKNGTSRRWVHNGFKELYRDELGYSDLEQRSDDESHRERARYRSREAKFSHPKDISTRGPRRSKSPHLTSSKMRPMSPSPNRRKSSPGSKKSRVTYSSSPTTSSSFSSQSSYGSRSRSGSSFSHSSSSSSGSSYTGSSSSSVSFRGGRKSYSKSRSKSPRRTKVEERRPTNTLPKRTLKPQKMLVKVSKKRKEFSRSRSVEPIKITSGSKKMSPTPALRMSDGEETVSDSSDDDEPEARKMTLSERFGKLAQLSSQRQEYEGVRMKIVREGGQDKKVYLEGLRSSDSPSPRKSRGAHEKWLREHKDEYDEYQKCYGEFRHWDPHRDLPRTIPPNWDDINVRYAYYKESGYFGDRKITMEDYLKWEEWWYRYKHWLEKFDDNHDREDWKTYENPPRWSRQSSREKPRKRRRY